MTLKTYIIHALCIFGLATPGMADLVPARHVLAYPQSQADAASPVPTLSSQGRVQGRFQEPIQGRGQSQVEAAIFGRSYFGFGFENASNDLSGGGFASNESLSNDIGFEVGQLWDWGGGGPGLHMSYDVFTDANGDVLQRLDTAFSLRVQAGMVEPFVMIGASQFSTPFSNESGRMYGIGVAYNIDNVVRLTLDYRNRRYQNASGITGVSRQNNSLRFGINLMY
jgi:hypothetical protein